MEMTNIRLYKRRTLKREIEIDRHKWLCIMLNKKRNIDGSGSMLILLSHAQSIDHESETIRRCSLPGTDRVRTRISNLSVVIC